MNMFKYSTRQLNNPRNNEQPPETLNAWQNRDEHIYNDGTLYTTIHNTLNDKSYSTAASTQPRHHETNDALQQPIQIHTIPEQKPASLECSTAVATRRDKPTITIGTDLTLCINM